MLPNALVFGVGGPPLPSDDVALPLRTATGGIWRDGGGGVGVDLVEVLWGTLSATRCRTPNADGKTTCGEPLLVWGATVGDVESGERRYAVVPRAEKRDADTGCNFGGGAGGFVID